MKTCINLVAGWGGEGSFIGEEVSPTDWVDQGGELEVNIGLTREES